MPDQEFINWIGTLPDEIIRDNFKLVVEKLKTIYSPGNHTLDGKPMSIRYSIDFPKNEHERLHFYIYLTTPKTLTEKTALAAFVKNVKFLAKAPHGSGINMGNMSDEYNIISMFSLHIPNVIKKGAKGIIHTKLGNGEHLLKIQFVDPHIGFKLEEGFSYKNVPLYYQHFTQHVITSFNHQFFAIIETYKVFAKSGGPLSPLVVPADPLVVPPELAAKIVPRPAPISPIVVPAAAKIVNKLKPVPHSPLVTNRERNKTRNAYNNQTNRNQANRNQAYRNQAYRNRAYQMIREKGWWTSFGEPVGYTNDKLINMYQTLEKDPEGRFTIEWGPTIAKTRIKTIKGGTRRRRRVTRKN